MRNRRLPDIVRILAAFMVIAASGPGIVPLCAQASLPALPPVEPEIIPLWPDDSPNNPAGGPRPTLEIYRTFAPARPADATIVILPGGGYRFLSPYEKIMAEYFRGLGYTTVVVNYRVMPNRYPAALADALRAIRLVRARVGEWHLPVKHLALLGGSAGGHLAALVSTNGESYRDPHDDLAGRISARPDRLILLYPTISTEASYRHPVIDQWLGPDANDELRRQTSPDKHVDRLAPPTIIFHAADDTIAVPDNSLAFAQACHAAGVPVELHLFPHGGHGRVFAYDAGNSPRWRALLQDWLSAWLQPDTARP
jgi:acetyl esterase/lipase